MNSEKIPGSGDFLSTIIRDQLRQDCIAEVATEASDSSFAEAKLHVAENDATPEDDGGIFVPCKLGACGVKLSLEEEQTVLRPTDCPRFETPTTTEK